MHNECNLPIIFRYTVALNRFPSCLGLVSRTVEARRESTERQRIAKERVTAGGCTLTFNRNSQEFTT